MKSLVQIIPQMKSLIVILQNEVDDGIERVEKINQMYINISQADNLKMIYIHFDVFNIVINIALYKIFKFQQ